MLNKMATQTAMVSNTISDDQPKPQRRRATIEPLSVDEIAAGNLQEGQELDFKREVDLDSDKHKFGLLDDVVAFLNRGPSRIVVGIVESGGRFGSFRPLSGDPDQIALRYQKLIQDSILPVPLDVQVVPIALQGGFLIDVQIPHHHGGPFVNRRNGSYLIRSGARNLPIDPGTLRSRFIDETTWMSRLDELTSAEDAAVAANGRVQLHRALRVGILPREHFDHMRAPFAQNNNVRSKAPSFGEHGRQFFEVCEDGHEARSINFSDQVIERLFIREDWFVHAHISPALYQRPHEGRLALGEFEAEAKAYFKELAEFFDKQEIEGPFAITLALQSLGKTENFGAWFKQITTIRTLRPRLVSYIDDPELIDGFLRQVRQASLYG